jgi:hypothetical protein
MIASADHRASAIAMLTNHRCAVWKFLAALLELIEDAVDVLVPLSQVAAALRSLIKDRFDLGLQGSVFLRGPSFELPDRFLAEVSNQSVHGFRMIASLHIVITLLSVDDVDLDRLRNPVGVIENLERVMACGHIVDLRGSGR